MTNQSNLELIKKIAAIDWDDDSLNELSVSFDSKPKKQDESLKEVKAPESTQPDQELPEDIGEFDRNVDENEGDTSFDFSTEEDIEQVPTSQQDEGVVPGQEGLIKEPKAPEKDNSASTLQDLLNQGYNLVRWVLGPEVSYNYKGELVTYPCGHCLAQKGLMDAASKKLGYGAGYIPLARFLDTDFSTGSPIFDSTHPDCRCSLEVTKLEDPSDVKYVTKDGLK